MSDLSPAPEFYEPMLLVAVRQADGMSVATSADDALARLEARARDASDRLTARLMARQDGPLSEQECRELAEHALSLAAGVIRGLNDCLNTGALSGYVAVSERRVATLIQDMAGAPRAQHDEISDIDPEIEGWLEAISVHVGPLRLGNARRDLVVREGFATVGAACALAAALMSRQTPATS